MRKFYVVAIVVVLVGIGLFAMIRFISPEDAWLCKNGQWVKHGNPSASAPTQSCGNLPIRSTRDYIIELFTQKYEKAPRSMIIRVITDTGTFAKGSYNEEGGGGLWFAAKTTEGWQLAYDGNGIIPCDIANKYNFPSDMIPQCIDTQNNNNLIKR